MQKNRFILKNILKNIFVDYFSEALISNKKQGFLALLMTQKNQKRLSKYLKK